MDFTRARALALDHFQAENPYPTMTGWTLSSWGLEDADHFGLYAGPEEWATGDPPNAAAVQMDPLLYLVEKATGKVRTTVAMVEDPTKMAAMEHVGTWPAELDTLTP